MSISRMDRAGGRGGRASGRVDAAPRRGARATRRGARAPGREVATGRRGVGTTRRGGRAPSRRGGGAPVRKSRLPGGRPGNPTRSPGSRARMGRVCPAGSPGSPPRRPGNPGRNRGSPRRNCGSRARGPRLPEKELRLGLRPVGVRERRVVRHVVRASQRRKLRRGRDRLQQRRLPGPFSPTKTSRARSGRAREVCGSAGPRRGTPRRRRAVEP